MSEANGSIIVCVILLGSTEQDIEVTISTEAVTAQGRVTVKNYNAYIL